MVNVTNLRFDMEDFDTKERAMGAATVGGNEIDEVIVLYDRGRLDVIVNGLTIMSDKSGASDFSFRVSKDNS